MPSLVVSYSHSEADIDETVEKVADALGVYRRALDQGIDKYLSGRSVRPTFRGMGDATNVRGAARPDRAAADASAAPKS
jgi:glutamate-1-semialdehyde 2,1-aminomutase